MPKIDLARGEMEKGRWIFSGWMFAQKFILTGLLTAFIFGGFRPFHSVMDWIIQIPILLGYGIIFGGFQAWGVRRRDEWILTNQRLAYFGLADEMDNVSVPLEQIRKVSRWFWWGLTIKMFDGKKISMKYLSSPSDIKREILMARDIVLERTT